MRTISVSRNDDGDIVYTTDFGTFTKEVTYRGYSIHNYMVEKLSGDWPSPKEVAVWCDERVSYFGGNAVLNEKFASVTCYIN